MKRLAFPKQKDCIIINDVPTKSEIKDDEIFGASSNLSMLTAFQRGKLLATQSIPEGFQGISPLKIHTTYLSFEPFEEGNFDWGNYWKKRKDVREILENGEIFLVPIEDFQGSALENSFYKIPHQKDLFVHKNLFDNIIGTLEEIKKVNPKLVILTGKWATFLLTGISSLAENYSKKVRDKPLGCIMKYRGSILSIHPTWELEVDCVVMPIIHPVNIWTMPVKIPIMLNDIHKLCWMFYVLQEQPTSFFKEPARTYLYGTDKKVILDYLDEILSLLKEKQLEVSVDIETMFGMPPKKVKGKLVGANNRKPIIDCIGLAYEEDRGLCIPYCSRENPLLWNLQDEIDIQLKLNEVLCHPNILIEGQNYSYDYQYIKKLYRLETPPRDDTMILSHTLFNNQPKDLATLASIYCPFYTYWKDESSADKDSPETRWIYNIKDILYTKQIKSALQTSLENSPKSLQDFYRFKVNELLPAVFHTMELGVPVDIEKKESQRVKFGELMTEIEETVNKIIAHTSSDGKNTINLKSSTQVKKLFMDYFEVEPIKNRKTGTETFGNDAMFIYMEQYPLLRPLIKLILEYRSINVFTNTFLSAIVDEDGCLRSNLNVVGTATDRLASRKNVFGGGANIQNVPAGGKIDLRYCLQSLEDEEESDIILEPEIEGSLELPNIKELFWCLQDEIYFDTDLASADARVIAWTSQCKFLTELYKEDDGDAYLFLAKEYYKDNSLVKKSKERQNFKIILHGTNYFGKERTLAMNANLLVHEVNRIQKYYFGACPEIPKLHQEVRNQVNNRGYLENCWGSRGWFTDKNDKQLLNKAMAWVGSSPVSTLINKIYVKLYQQEKGRINIRLQVHDSLAGTFNKFDTTAPDRILEAAKIPMNFYGKDYFIPVGLKLSDKSYGNCSDKNLILFREGKL